MKALNKLVETVRRRRGVISLGAYLVLTGISNTFGPAVASVLWDIIFYTLETAIIVFGMLAYIRERSSLDILMGLGVIAYKAVLIASIYYGAFRSGGDHAVFISFILSNVSAIVATPVLTLILFLIMRFNKT